MQNNIPAVYLIEASMQPPMEILHFEANPDYEVLQTDGRLRDWAGKLEDGFKKGKQRFKEKASNLHAKVKDKAHAAVEKVREKTKEQRKRLANKIENGAKRIYNVHEDSDNDEDL